MGRSISTIWLHLGISSVRLHVAMLSSNLETIISLLRQQPFSCTRQQPISCTRQQPFSMHKAAALQLHKAAALQLHKAAAHQLHKAAALQLHKAAALQYAQGSSPSVAALQLHKTAAHQLHNAVRMITLIRAMTSCSLFEISLKFRLWTSICLPGDLNNDLEVINNLDPMTLIHVWISDYYSV